MQTRSPLWFSLHMPAVVAVSHGLRSTSRVHHALLHMLMQSLTDTFYAEELACARTSD